MYLNFDTLKYCIVPLKIEGNASKLTPKKLKLMQSTPNTVIPMNKFSKLIIKNEQNL